MTWLIIALASSACLGLISISDKVVFQKYVRTPLSLILVIGIIELIVGVIMLIVSGIPTKTSIYSNLIAIISGALIAFAILLLQKLLYTREVSRTVPITQSSPIFTALVALIMLGESISSQQWLGIITAVLGSILISLKLDTGTAKILLHRSFYLLMLSAFFYGTSNVTSKIALEELPVLYTQGMRTVTFGLILISYAFRSEAFADVKSLIRKRSPALKLIMVNQFITAQIGSFLLLWALSLGPASLVAAIAGTRGLFTLVYSIGISKIWVGILGEDTSNQSVMIKLISTLLIVVGVVAIAI